MPIAKYSDNTFFSSTAYLLFDKQDDESAVFSKVFLLDTISKKQIQGGFVNDGAYSLIHKIFERVYLSRGSMRPVFDWIMRLRKILGIQTRFVRVLSRGKVVVTYCYRNNSVKVHIDLSELDKKQCKEILILNEQGATFFPRHTDSEGAKLCNRQIGAWSRIVAKNASFSDNEGRVSFSMETLKGSTLYRGWEQVNDRFSWAGMTYALNPATSSFSYAIRINLQMLGSGLHSLQGENKK